MPGDFHDHARKRLIRERWNTPLLERLSEAWGSKYVYCGLPGPEVLDLMQWKDMIAAVIAFEIEQEQGDPRSKLVELSRQLRLLQASHDITSAVYCGPMEEVVLRRVDRDGKPFAIGQFVTLYNLDFCNSITGRVTVDGNHQCLRFEALRELMSLQRNFFRETGSSRFVLFITTHDSFHVSPVRDLLTADDVHTSLVRVFRDSHQADGFPRRGIVERRTDCLKAFVFAFLRDCFHGQNVRSVFLPPIAYTGISDRSPMLHFAVVCEMGSQNAARTPDPQTVASFLALSTLRATDDALEADGECRCGRRIVLDPIRLLRQYRLLAK